jgi:hypothetical protein
MPVSHRRSSSPKGDFDRLLTIGMTLPIATTEHGSLAELAMDGPKPFDDFR